MFVEAERVEISVTFTWDLPLADRLADEWERIAPVSIGGPATGWRSQEFVPGQYLRKGYVITSRGCPNFCSHCLVWRREGEIRELAITEGWIVQDDNLLACSRRHVEAVFAMLARQPERAVFAGGLEAARLKDWHVNLLASLKPRPRVFFAYDNPSQAEPLLLAAEALWEAGFTPQSHRVACYVLIGFGADTMAAAEKRLEDVRNLGLMPFAMLYQGEDGIVDPEWKRFQRCWARPAAIYAARRLEQE